MPTEGFVWALAVVLALIVVALVILWRGNRDIDVSLGPLRLKTESRGRPSVEERQLAAAFDRYSDIAQGLLAVLETESEETARNWFTFVCAGLSTVLSTGPSQTFRAAIWHDHPAEDHLEPLGVHLLDANAPNRKRLPRDRSIAGLVSRGQSEVYVADRRTDSRYDPLGPPEKPYLSIFAVPLQQGRETWGALTVDAVEANGFSDVGKQLCRKFAGLATVGYVAWNSMPAQRDKIAGTGV